MKTNNNINENTFVLDSLFDKNLYKFSNNSKTIIVKNKNLIIDSSTIGKSFNFWGICSISPTFKLLEIIKIVPSKKDVPILIKDSFKKKPENKLNIDKIINGITAKNGVEWKFK